MHDTLRDMVEIILLENHWSSNKVNINNIDVYYYNWFWNGSYRTYYSPWNSQSFQITLEFSMIGERSIPLFWWKWDNDGWWITIDKQIANYRQNHRLTSCKFYHSNILRIIPTLRSNIPAASTYEASFLNSCVILVPVPSTVIFWT